MKQLLLFIACLGCAALHAQAPVRTDTVKPGYYIPFDSTFLSCKVSIAPKGKKVEFTNTTGNRLPDSLVRKIGKLDAGSVVVYGEVTVFNNGIAQKAPSVRYVIGSRNSVYAKKDPSIPDTIPGAEIGSIVLDQHVYAFTVTWLINGNMYMYDHTGNGVAPNVKEELSKLPPGTKVWFENIKRKEDNGSLTIAPTQLYIVK